jgi:hypothetical protein
MAAEAFNVGGFRMGLFQEFLRHSAGIREG